MAVLLWGSEDPLVSTQLPREGFALSHRLRKGSVACNVKISIQSTVATIVPQSSEQPILGSKSMTHPFLVQGQTGRRVNLGYTESSRLAWSYGKAPFQNE